MTIDELQQLAAEFRAAADKIRELGNRFPATRANSVLFVASISADYANLAAAYVQNRIETMEIAKIAQEELPCATSR